MPRHPNCITYMYKHMCNLLACNILYMYVCTHTHTQVIKETMRLPGIVGGSSRKCPAGGVTLSGHHIPAGTTMVVSLRWIIISCQGYHLSRCIN